MTRKKIILITGPTASGKTALGIAVARKLNTDIISADSRQCFRELNIGVAKPSADQLAQVKHYFVNTHSIHDPVSAGVFEAYALQATKEIFASHDTAVMVGGTGLYIKAFTEGLDDIPNVSEELRRQIAEQYRTLGVDWLQKEVAMLDPVYYSDGENQNPQRLMRALEVKLSTGKSIRAFQRAQSADRNFDVGKFALDIPREQLACNIGKRVDDMVEQGLVEEVRALRRVRQLNALQTVGYTELFDYFDGTRSLHEAIERIKINTRHYAKRQLTWFRKDPEIRWIKSEQEIKI